MKCYLILMCFFISNLCFAGKSKAKIEPMIVVKQTEFSFGDVYKKEDQQFEIEISNLGASDLSLKDIVAECGVKLKKDLELTKALVPGERFVIEVKIDSSFPEGDYSKKVTIFSDDLYKPEVVVHVHFSILKEFDFLPKVLKISDNNKKHLIKKVDFNHSGINIVEIKYDQNILNVKKTKENHYLVEWKSSSHEDNSTEIEFILDSNHQPKYSYRIFKSHKTRHALSASKLNFGKVSKGAKKYLSFEVISSNKLEIKSLKIEASGNQKLISEARFNKMFELVEIPSSKGRQVRVGITNSDKNNIEINGIIKISTNYEDLEIPVKATLL